MIPHENPDGSHNQDEHDEMEQFDGQRFVAVVDGLDLERYDAMMAVYIRGWQGKLLMLWWPMKLGKPVRELLAHAG